MSDLRKGIEDWLNKQGFPLEFKAAQVFAASGYETEQGVYLPDPKEGLLREIDVVASKDPGAVVELDTLQPRASIGCSLLVERVGGVERELANVALRGSKESCNLFRVEEFVGWTGGCNVRG